jgi:hypothetical protein
VVLKQYHDELLELVEVGKQCREYEHKTLKRIMQAQFGVTAAG